VPPRGEAEELPVPRCTRLERGGDEVLAVPSEIPGFEPVAPLESVSAGLKKKKREDKKRQPEGKVWETKQTKKQKTHPEETGIIFPL
jgi:hypothetical protein